MAGPVTDKTKTSNDIEIPLPGSKTTDDTTKMDIKSYWASLFKPTVTLSNTDGISKGIQMPNNPFFSGIKINIKPYPGGYVSIKTDAGEIIKPIIPTPMMDDEDDYDIADYYEYPVKRSTDEKSTTTKPDKTTKADKTRTSLGYDPTLFWKTMWPMWMMMHQAAMTTPTGTPTTTQDTNTLPVGRVPLYPTNYDPYTEDIYDRIPRSSVFTDFKKKKDDVGAKDKETTKDTKEVKDTTMTEEKPLTLSELNRYFWVTPKSPEQIEWERQMEEQGTYVTNPYGWWNYPTRMTPRTTPTPVNPWGRMWGTTTGSRTTGTGIRQPTW